MIEQFSVHLVRLDPTVGSEIRKTRPCLVVSPDDLNRHLRTALVAPLTTAGREYVSRVPCRFAGKPGYVALDQLRCADHGRFVRRLGRLDAPTADLVMQTLRDMFS